MKLWERGRAFLFLLVVGLPALSYPLSWLPRSWAHFRFSVAVPWPEVVLAAILLVSVGVVLRERDAGETEGSGIAWDLVPRSLLLPVLAVMASGVVSTRFSEHSHFGLTLLPQLVGNLAIFLLAAHVSRPHMAKLCQWWIIVAVIVGANGLLRLRSEPEFISTLGNWDFLGAYLAASVIMALSIGGWWRFLGTLVLLSAMWFCRSRGAWLALGGTGVLYFLGWGNRFPRHWQARAIVTLLLLATAGLLARPYVLRQWQTDVRPMIWKATLRMIAARPILGHGLGSYVAGYPRYRLPEYFLRPKATNVTDHAHNELLEIAAEQGVVGLAATLWLWATTLWCGIRACQQSSGTDRRVMIGLLGATLVLMFHGLVDVDLRHLPNESLLWLLMGLLVGADLTPGQARVTSLSKPVRWCAAAACLALGIWCAMTAVIRPMMADWRDRAARIAEEDGDFQGAVQFTADALRLQPFRLSTRYLLAGVLSRLPDAQGRDAAIDQCLWIEELAPDYADVTYNLGQLYLAANRAPEAFPYFRRAVEINPYDANRHVALAVALHGIGRDDEAVSQLDRALQLQPNLPGTQELRQDLRKEHARRPLCRNIFDILSCARYSGAAREHL
jgi:O-antigen ligase